MYSHSGKSMKIYYKTKHVTTIQPRNYTLGHLPLRSEKVCACEHLYLNVHSTFSYNRQRLETVKMVPLMGE